MQSITPAAPDPHLLAAFDDLDPERLRDRRSEKWRHYPPEVLPVWVAEMDYPLARPVAEALHRAIELGDTGYASGEGLAEAFAGFARARFDWPVDSSDVHLLPDVMTGVSELLRVVTGPGAGVVVNSPVYPPFFSTVAEAGRRVVDVPLVGAGDPDAGVGRAEGVTGRWTLDLAAIEAAYAAGARAHLLCNPHNPVGRVVTRDELAALAELADHYGVTVIADEIHAPLTLPGARHVPFLTVSAAARRRGVVLTSASKGWNVPGLKAAVLVTGGAEQRENAGRVPPEVRFRAGHLGVLAAEAAFTAGVPWLDAARAHIAGNHRLLRDLLAERLPAVRVRPAEATYLAWLDCRDLGLGENPARVFRQRGQVALSPGAEFGAAGAGFARFNVATSPALIAQAVDRMARAVAG